MDILGRLARELNGPSPGVAQRIFWERQRRHSPAAQFIARLLPVGGCGVDIGAAQGLYTVGMLSSARSTGSVFAFEPNPEQARALHTMARRRRQLTVYEVALSDHAGTADFMVPVVDGMPYLGMGSLEDPRHKVAGRVDTFSVITRRLDDVLGSLPRIDVIKIDVEGHEDAVLAGSHEILSKHRPTLLIEMEQRHRGGDPRPAMRRLIDDYGLTGWAIFPDGLRPLSDFDLERDQLRFLTGDDGQRLPTDYISDFLFTPAGR